MLTAEQREDLWPRENTPAGRYLFEQGAVIRAARAALQRRVGMSEARLRMLGIIFRLGEVSQSELQRRMDVDGAAVTRQGKQMESEGLLVRRVDPADNRFTLVTLTPQGGERLREVARMAREFIAESLEGVSDEELECVRAVTARVRANIEKL
jgi:DNA-binding MarR family transcriptional regulator